MIVIAAAAVAAIAQVVVVAACHSASARFRSLACWRSCKDTTDFEGDSAFAAAAADLSTFVLMTSKREGALGVGLTLELHKTHLFSLRC